MLTKRSLRNASARERARPQGPHVNDYTVPQKHFAFGAAAREITAEDMPAG